MPTARDHTSAGCRSYSFGVLRINVSLVQLVQAVSIAGFGLAIAFVPLVLVWALDRAFEPDLLLLWRAAADSWLIGHGVTLHVDLPEAAALDFGSELAAKPFDVTLWPLGFTVFTVVMSMVSARRLHEAAHGMAADVRARIDAVDGIGTPERIIGQVLGWGVAATTLAMSAIGVLVAWSALHPVAAPSLWQAALLPALAVLLTHAVTLFWLDRERLLDRLADRIAIPDRWTDILSASLAAAGATITALIGLGAAAAALTIFTHFDQLVALTEAASPTLLGVIVLFLAQLALLPNAVLWGSAFMVGAPVRVGSGSEFSVFGSALGPMPNVPLFGAVPAEPEPWFPALLVVTALTVLVLAMLVARQRLPFVERWWEPAAVAGIAGAASAVVLVLLTGAAGGALGPGRMQVSGPDPLQVFLIVWIGTTLLIAAGFWGFRALEIATEREETDAGAWLGAEDDDVSPWSREATANRAEEDADPGSLVERFDTADVDGAADAPDDGPVNSDADDRRGPDPD